jgi:hypothetical protein
MKNRLIAITLLLLSFVNTSCGNSYERDREYLYDKVGFEPGRSPSQSDPRVNRSPAVPDYYYRYGPTVPAGSYAPQPQYQYQYAPSQYAPYQNRPYQAPGSRFYSNPYDVPPSPYYNKPYDADQYYVPPTNYYGSEQGGQNSNNAIHY